MKNQLFQILPLSLITIFLALIGTAQAQAPQKFSYQSIIRDAGGQALSNQPVSMRLSILQGSDNGTAVFVETHSGNTNSQGLISLQIGGGIVVSGSISGIDWATGPYFIKTETDPEGGSNYSITGTSPMLSVPYALYAASGTQGPKGDKGDPGEIGPQGPTGPNGNNALIRTTPEAAGANCANGGIKIEAGLDADGNGQLADTEVNASQTKYLCNGANGATGATGAQGPAGPAGSGGFVHYVGEEFGGGVVFHVYRDASGTERGLVVALTNQSEGAAWSNITNSLAGASSSWDGLANSNAIVAQAGHTSSAAKICLDYEYGGFSDWYLPSRYEINLLWGNFFNVNKSLSSIVGAIEIFPANSGAIYWSSSEYGSSGAWHLFTGGGISYGLDKDYAGQVRAVRTFSVPSNSGSVTDIDGNTYETVTIGSQVWMKENLKVSKYRNGDAIPTGLSNSAWQNTTNGACTIYDNNPVNDSIYGKLYNWYAVADPRGLCPAGWHVPSDSEWKQLESYLGMPSGELDNSGLRGGAQNIGGKLKSTSNLWQSPNTGATNTVGFSAIPGAYRNIDGPYYGLGVDAVWWSSSVNGTNKAWSRLLTKGDGNSARFDYHLKTYGFSVRCLKD